MAVGRRAAAHDRAAARDDGRRSASSSTRLAGHQLAGLGFGTGFTHETVPPALLEAAEERGFPLFEVPYEVPFIAVTEKAFTHLVNEQYAVLQRAISAHERLERIVLSERGLDGVAAALSSLIGGAVLIFDARGECSRGARSARRWPTRPSSRWRDELRERARAAAAPQLRARRRHGAGGRALALPVAAHAGRHASRRVPQAWLVAAKDAGQLTEFDRLTLHQAVTIVALELLRRRVAEDTERRLAGDVLSAMVCGELAGAELVRRLEPFGLAERVGALVLAAAARRAQGRRGGARRRGARGGAGRPASPGPGASGRAAAPARACRRRADEDALFALAERVRARVAERSGVQLPAGAGPRGAGRRRAAHVPRGALRARGAGARRPTDERRRGPGWRPTGTSAPSSCCSRSRTTRRCGCSATRSSARSRPARAPTAAS